VYAVAEYLKETGDHAFLDKAFPYLDSTTREPVWSHLIKAVSHLFRDRSSYGLCRMRFADWNDGLDGVGSRGIGDSTMVTFGLIYALRELREIARITNRSVPFDVEGMITELENALETHAWTGEYYIRGYRDDGQPYGSPDNEYGKIYLNPQAWAVLSEGTPSDRWTSLLRLAIDWLGTPWGLRLFAPCYPHYDPYIGRASAELPGVYENGAMYNHGAAFFLHALAKADLVDEAWKYLAAMLPDSDANPSDRSGAEPFVLTNCIFGEEAKHRAGTSYFGWYTGTAAWVLRLVHNRFTGFSPEWGGIFLRPKQIPDGMRISGYRRIFRNTQYILDYGNRGRDGSIVVDGVLHDPAKPLPAAPGSVVRIVVNDNPSRNPT
jgi:cellobiose phosphorylase